MVKLKTRFSKQEMISDRQALLQRAKQRIHEKRMLQEAALGEVDSTVPRVPLDFQPLPSPTSRYRRTSLNFALDVAPKSANSDIVLDESAVNNALPIKESSETPVHLVKNDMGKIDLHIETFASPLNLTPSTSTRLQPISKTPRSLERILERGVSITPIDAYLGLALTPTEPIVESVVEKKRKFHLLKRNKKQPIPDELPIKQEGRDIYLC